MRPGPKPREEENEFAEFLVEASKGWIRKQVINIAENVAQDKGILGTDSKLSNGWYYHFMERQGDLTLRKGDPIANVRMECLNEVLYNAKKCDEKREFVE